MMLGQLRPPVVLGSEFFTPACSSREPITSVQEWPLYYFGARRPTRGTIRELVFQSGGPRKRRARRQVSRLLIRLGTCSVVEPYSAPPVPESWAVSMGGVSGRQERPRGRDSAWLPSQAVRATLATPRPRGKTYWVRKDRDGRSSVGLQPLPRANDPNLHRGD